MHGRVLAFPQEESEGSLKIFLRQTFGLQPQVCLRKSKDTLSILRNLPREHFYLTTLRFDQLFVPQAQQWERRELELFQSKKGCTEEQDRPGV